MSKQYTKATITEKESNGVFTAIASTSTVDRHGEIVSVEGWNLSNFKKNPVLLWAHDHTIPAIGNATKVWIEGTGKAAKLMFKGKFQQATEQGKALTQLVKDGVLNSFSVGFLPTEMDGNNYTEQELLEISLVNVPANPDAQITAYKSLKKAGFKEDIMEDVGIYAKVVDKLVSMENDISNLNKKVETLVKAPPAAAPKAHKTITIRKRQSLVKSIAKATDQLLANEKKGSTKENRVQSIKIIKRSAEILSKSHKEQINGKN